MERTIKFRGRSTHSDDWCYGSFVNNPDEPTICGFDIWADGDSDWREEKVEPHTVGQYTGLCDSNCKEIYEGDIFHIGDKNLMHEVVWHDTGFIGKQIGCYGSYVGLEHWADRIEVIGNVHDNPELLKGYEK